MIDFILQYQFFNNTSHSTNHWFFYSPLFHVSSLFPPVPTPTKTFSQHWTLPTTKTIAHPVIIQSTTFMPLTFHISISRPSPNPHTLKIQITLHFQVDYKLSKGVDYHWRPEKVLIGHNARSICQTVPKATGSEVWLIQSINRKDLAAVSLGRSSCRWATYPILYFKKSNLEERSCQ